MTYLNDNQPNYTVTSSYLVRRLFLWYELDDMDRGLDSHIKLISFNVAF
ncbi:predicted protein [Sclerotinia sclerotiorum 1980 UF-70]|uniref:Uncharacterized protein n=1 Tax=Sclerotinia sclerotiorum (strain ATCC 18683 / 1980 / Ss-1) TaxID=665079 RepID=A7F7N2_SCLS1|nr:predicted protein [Sclerotinia sclerotiorum 1980 UF-70]EDN98753.1 predicted protein [Sclerotinia sclerotiorum 1980 UF-70]